MPIWCGLRRGTLRTLCAAVVIALSVSGCGQTTGNASVTQAEPGRHQDGVLRWSFRNGLESQEHSVSALDSSRLVLGHNRIVITGPADSFGRVLEYGASQISDDIVEVLAAYPSVRDAEFFLISTSIVGSCCPWQSLHIARGGALIALPSINVTHLEARRIEGEGLLISARSTETDPTASGPTIEWELGPLDANFVERGVRRAFPTVGQYLYPSQVLGDRALVRALLGIPDEEIEQLQAMTELERPVRWLYGSAMWLCSTGKGRLADTQIVLIDLKAGSHEVQRFRGSRLVSTRKSPSPVRTDLKVAVAQEACARAAMR